MEGTNWHTTHTTYAGKYIQVQGFLFKIPQNLSSFLQCGGRGELLPLTAQSLPVIQTASRLTVPHENEGEYSASSCIDFTHIVHE